MSKKHQAVIYRIMDFTFFAKQIENVTFAQERTHSFL